MLKDTGRRMASTVCYGPCCCWCPQMTSPSAVTCRILPAAPFRATGSPSPTATRHRPLVSLPLPDCTARPSDCADIRALNELDGFSIQPRIILPFNGAIDPATVNSGAVFLLNLGDTTSGAGAGQRVELYQVVWDAPGKTVAFGSGQLLIEHPRNVLIVTDGVRDRAGKKLKSVDRAGDAGVRLANTGANRAMRCVPHVSDPDGVAPYFEAPSGGLPEQLYSMP